MAAIVVLGAADSSATYQAGARPGLAWTERIEPEPGPEPELSRAGVRSFREPAASSASARRPPRRAAPPAGPEGGGAPAAPPSTARPPHPLLLPASLLATCQLRSKAEVGTLAAEKGS